MSAFQGKSEHKDLVLFVVFSCVTAQPVAVSSPPSVAHQGCQGELRFHLYNTT